MPAQLDRFVELQVIDVDRSFSGIAEAGHVDLDLVNQLLDHAALPHAGRLAADSIGSVTFDHLVAEIRVKSTWTTCVPQVSHCKSRINADSFTAPVEVTRRLPCRIAAVRARPPRRSAAHFQTVPVEHGRNLARQPQPPVAMLSPDITRLTARL